MPVRDYDNLLVGEYIRSIENPDSIGFKDGKWFQSPRKVDDPNNRGFGVDIKYNDKARELVKDRKGKWLSEEEERDLRNSHIDYVMRRIDKWTPQMLQEMPSEEKRAMAAGMLYRGDGIKTIIKNPALRDAFYSGTPEEFSKAVEDFYKDKKSNHYQPERARLHKEFMDKQPFNQLSFKVTDFKPDNSLFDKGGLLEPKDAWDRLSIPEKADIIKVGVKYGIFDLQELRRKYNEFKEEESEEGEEVVNTEESYNQSVEESAVPNISGYLNNISPSSFNFSMYSPTEHSIGGPLVDDANYRDENIYGLGDWLKKGLNWLKNSAQVAAIAESPSVMTAAGHRVTREGKAVQDRQNSKDVKQLRQNLANFGEGALWAMTATGDVEAAYNVLRHPVQTAKTLNEGANAVYQGIQNIFRKPLTSMDRFGQPHELPIRTMRGGVMDYSGNLLSDEELISNWKRSQDFYKMRLRNNGLEQLGHAYTVNKDNAIKIAKKYEPDESEATLLKELDELGGAYALPDGKDGYGIVTKELNTMGKQRKGTTNSATVHESAHLMRGPEEMEDINWSNLILDEDEAAARGSQIKSMLGIRDNTPITSEQLKYMKDNYVRLTNMDNNMQLFLDSITDFDSAAAWLSRNSFSLGGAMNLLGVVKNPKGKKGL